MRRYFTFLLCLVLVVNSVSIAFAFPGFSTDEQTSKEGFASAFGWNLESIDSDEWTNESGDTYRRMTSHQKEKFYDALKSAQDYALQLGIITSRTDDTGGFGGYRLAAVAKNEVGADGSWETPPYSNRVKYNDYHSAAWCASFVSWCAMQCGFVDSGLFPYTASAPEIEQYLVFTNGFSEYPLYSVSQFGGSEYSACVGDIIIFQWGAHVGIVTDVDSNGIEVVHGNAFSGDGLDQVRAEWMDADRFCQSWSAYRLNNCFLIHVEYPSPNGSAMGFNGDSTAILYEVYWYARVKMGLNDAAIAGICGNINHENTHWNPYNDTGDFGSSWGLCQWYAGRRDRMFEMCYSQGLDPFDPDPLAAARAQMWYLHWELTNEWSYANTWNTLRGVSNTPDGAYAAAQVFCREFEKCANVDYQADLRGQDAQYTFFPMFQKGMSRLPPSNGGSSGSGGSGSGGVVKPKPGIGDQPIVIPQ